MMLSRFLGVLLVAVLIGGSAMAQNLPMSPDKMVSLPWNWTGAQSEPPCAPSGTTGTITFNLSGCSNPVNAAKGGSPSYYQVTLTGNATIAMTGGNVGQVFQLDIAVGTNNLTIPQPPFDFQPGTNTTAAGNSSLICRIHDATPSYWCPGGVAANIGILFTAVPGASNSCASSAGNNACTTTTTNMSGVNLIVACHAFDTSGGASSSFSDSLGNLYNTVYSTVVNSNTTGALYYKQAPSVSGSMTFTASASGNAFQAIAVEGFTGAIPNPLDQSTNPANTVTTGAVSLQPGLITPGQANELLATCLATNHGTTNTITSPFTLGPSVNAAANNDGVALAYQIQSPGPTAQNPTWGWTVTGAGVAGQASFK